MASEFNSLEDLVFSRSFRNWVLSRDSSEHAFWENWVQCNPEKAEIVKNAKAVVYALHLNTAVLSADEIDEEARKALIRLKEAPRYIPLEGLEGRGGRWRGILRSPGVWVVALLAGAITLGGSLYYQAYFRRDLLSVFRNNHKLVHEQAADASMEQTFHLPDGSLVRLGKRSQLYFEPEWGPDKARREVFLEGVASFDIRKNPAVPFYVYTDKLITRALRATIVIHAFPMDVQTVVTDKSGSVSVYRQGDFAEHSAGRNEVAGIVLGPNQEVVYDRKEDRMRKTLAERPEPLEERPDTALVFQRTPIRQVFSQLYELYGIPIQYDGGVLDSCLLTATMGRQSFYERLDFICKAIGGAYEVIDGSVVVTAVGCR
jgi:transmembrane sensor